MHLLGRVTGTGPGAGLGEDALRDHGVLEYDEDYQGESFCERNGYRSRIIVEKSHETTLMNLMQIWLAVDFEDKHSSLVHWS